MQSKCQLQNLPAMIEGEISTESTSLIWQFKLFLKRRMNATTKGHLKRRVNRLVRVLRPRGKPALPVVSASMPDTHLQAGDLVRVRSREQIEAMLDTWQQWKGCVFMPGMWQYCGTTQRVLKPVERFLDERDYRMKTCRGIVLLDGLMCQGLPNYGRCDRSCLFFWREEWLERVDGSVSRPEATRSADELE